MSRPNYTHATLLVDRSGSMSNIREATIAGFNRFRAEQQKIPGEATVSLIQFDDHYEPNYIGTPLMSMPQLTTESYVPRGGTSLFDAWARAMRETGAWLAAMPEPQRPGKVLFIVITDGQENSSVEFGVYTGGAAKLRALVETQRTQFAWQFIFLGANQDAILNAVEFGVPTGGAINFAASDVGIKQAFSAASSATAGMRSDSYAGGSDFFGGATNAADVPETTTTAP